MQILGSKPTFLSTCIIEQFDCLAREREREKEFTNRRDSDEALGLGFTV